MNRKHIIIILSAIIVIIFQDNAFAKDYASFESFYRESLSLKSWVIGGVLAVAGVTLVFFTSGAAAPFVGAIGSAIGGMMGLSGAAATSAGLAWLGGGALAAGGYGVFGGTVLLTAIFEGSLLGGTQYIQHKVNQMNYVELCEQVKDYPNLPPILNTDGPKEIEDVVELFKKAYEIDQLPSTKVNIDVINVANSIVSKYDQEEDRFYKIGYDTVMRHEQLRIHTLQAILFFMANDYKSSYKKSVQAREFHKSVADDGIYSVIDFIYSVSGLMANNIDMKTSLSHFRVAIKSEAKNPLIPLLYSIYISRVGAIDKISIGFIREIGEFCELIEDEKIKCVVSIQVVTASLAKIWESQQMIRLLADNSGNIDLDKGIKMVKEAYENYKTFLSYARTFILTIPKNEDSREFLDKATASLKKYSSEEQLLGEMIKSLECKKTGADMNFDILMENKSEYSTG